MFGHCYSGPFCALLFLANFSFCIQLFRYLTAKVPGPGCNRVKNATLSLSAHSRVPFTDDHPYSTFIAPLFHGGIMFAEL